MATAMRRTRFLRATKAPRSAYSSIDLTEIPGATPWLPIVIHTHLTHPPDFSLVER